MHLEDQVQAKRCGHRPGKALVSAGADGEVIAGARACACARATAGA